MKLLVREIKELTGWEYHSCYQLNLRGKGLMRERLITCKNYGNGHAVMLQNDDGILLSWALVFEWDLNKDLYGAYFYTRKSARRRGFGDLVAREASQQFKNIVVWPSDNQGRDFFNNYNFEQRMTYWCG